MAFRFSYFVEGGPLQIFNRGASFDNVTPLGHYKISSYRLTITSESKEKNCVTPLVRHVVKAGLDWTCKIWTGLICKTWTGLICKTWTGLICKTWTGLICKTWTGLICKKWTFTKL